MTSPYPLKGSVYYNDTAPFSLEPQLDPDIGAQQARLRNVQDQPGSNWKARLGALGRVLGGIASALPSNSAGYASNGTNTPNLLDGLSYQPVHTNLNQGASRPVKARQIQINPSQSSAGTQALSSVAKQRAQVNQETIQESHGRAVNALDDLARAQGLPFYQDWHRQNGIPYNVSLPQGGFASALSQANRSNPPFQARQEMSVGFEQTKQNLRNAQAELLAFQNPIDQAQSLRPDFQIHWVQPKVTDMQRQASARPSQESSSNQAATAHKPLKGYLQKTNQDALLWEEAFHDPQNSEQNILQQMQGKEALPASKLEQAELNLARMQAAGKISSEQTKEALQMVQLGTAHNWIAHHGKANKDGSLTYRGMIVPKRVGPLLAYTDTQHYLKTGQHLSTRGNWQEKMLTAGQNFLEGIGHGLSAGGAFKSKSDLLFVAGDMIGTIGANIALATGTAGVGTPAALALYWAARETNREADAGKPLNPAAIAGAGALGAIPGTVALKSTLGPVARVAAGAGLGYVQDVGNRVIEQAGDTGKVDLRMIDYTPGLGTAAGGALSHPIIVKAFHTHLLGLASKIRQGEKVHIPTYEEFAQAFKKEHGWTDENIAFFENKPNGVAPANYPFNRPLWSPGEYNNPLHNAYEHSTFPDHPDAYGLPPGDPRYVQKVHDLLDNLPYGTELMETKAGMKRYFSPNAGPNEQNIFTVEDPNRAPRTSYIPGGTPEEQYAYFQRQGGKYKGKIK
jgi:hypothetical protein